MIPSISANITPGSSSDKKKPETKKKKPNKTLKSMYEDATSFSKFDPITGEKVAETEVEDKEASESGRRMANMEMGADARKTKSSPNSPGETLKDAATGGSLAFLTSNSLIKGVHSGRIKAGIGLAGAIGTGLLSAKKQVSEYNRQQGARENIAGKQTGRSKAYRKMLTKKYDTK